MAEVDEIPIVEEAVVIDDTALGLLDGGLDDAAEGGKKKKCDDDCDAKINCYYYHDDCVDCKKDCCQPCY